MADGDGTPRRSKTVKHIIRYEQNTVASLNSYRSRVRVKLTHCVRSVGYLHRTRREGQHKNATPKTANRPVGLFCFVSTWCLVYYFLLFLDPNLTISYLATLAGLNVQLK